LHRNEEAAAAAKSALDGADDPELLNDGAYTLSETGLDLAVAEDASRKSIARQEERTAAITTAEAGSSAFAQANLLVASWDTLGWILFREGKLDDAEAMLAAAWRASLRAEVGDHLAQLYEAQGKKDKAAVTYALAQASNTPPAPPEVRRHIDASISRLRAGKPGESNKNSALVAANATQALQDLRTYKIDRPAGASGWGTFRLEITTTGVIESQQMSGEQHLAALKPVIDAMKFPGLVPPGSKAHLLRSAVVSCSMSKTCEVVLVPDGGLQTEQQ
jgi:tetratricopeptide (TPR) repeat protein